MITTRLPPVLPIPPFASPSTSHAIGRLSPPIRRVSQVCFLHALTGHKGIDSAELQLFARQPRRRTIGPGVELQTTQQFGLTRNQQIRYGINPKWVFARIPRHKWSPLRPYMTGGASKKSHGGNAAPKVGALFTPYWPPLIMSWG